jgi:DNA/RNA endonuclease YhcR with UshA esterase domain
MLLRQERLAFVLLVIVAIGIILGSIALAGIDKGTFAKDFSPMQPEGSLVRIDGIVEELRWTQTGGHLNARVEGTQVFIPAAAAKKITLRKGDHVLIYGIIQTYRGEKEVVVQNAGDVKQLSGSNH